MELQWFVISVLVGFEAAWMTLAVLNNVRHAEHNRASVVAVMQMTWVAEDMPESYTAFQHRRCLSDAFPHAAFRIVVMVECCTALALWVASITALLVAFGMAAATIAAPVVVLGSLAFCVPWAAFLIGGEWFVYFATSRSPQHTHFFLLIWGILTLIAISLLAA